MKKVIKLLSSFILTLGLFVSCQEKAVWYSDFEEGQKIAQKSDKCVFLNFTSDSDEISSRLDENAFKKDEFLKKYSKNFVFVNLDYSSRLKAESLNPDATDDEKIAAQKVIEETQNAIAVSEKYGVTSLPTSLVLSKDGYVIDELNFYDIREDFDPNNPDSANASIDEVVTIYDFDKICSTFDSALLKVDEYKSYLQIIKTGKDDDAKIESINQIFDNTDFKYRHLLKDFSQMVVDLDKEDKSGSVAKHIISVANAEAIAYGKDVSKVCDIFTTAAENEKLSPNDKQLMYYQAAMVLIQSKVDFVKAKDLLNKSLNEAPESESSGLITSIIGYVDMMTGSVNESVSSENK